MVQRVIDTVVVSHGCAAPAELQRPAMETTTRKVKRRRRRLDAMTAIKARMLRCSRANKADQGRFKRGYLAAGCGAAADSAAVDSTTVFFYLACLVCTARPSASASGSKN